MPSVIPRETPFSRPAQSHEEFIARLNSVEKIVNSDNLLLNEDLGATKKGGFHWIVRVIMNPLGHLFCRDLLSDVRINRVAQKLEEYLRINQQHFASTDSSREVKDISDRIIAQLNKRTHNRYNTVLDRVLKQPNDRLAGLEHSEADAAQRAAWTTELNGLRDTVANNQNQQVALQANFSRLGEGLEALRQTVGRNQNQQSGNLQELRNQQASLREGFNGLRRELGELSRAVAKNQNPQNGELQGLRELQEGFNGLRGELERLGQTMAGNHNSQNGGLQGLREQQASLQTALDKLGEGLERLGQTVAGNHNSHNGELQGLRKQQAGLQAGFDKLGEGLGELRQTVGNNQNSQEALQAGLEGLRNNLGELKLAMAGAQNPQNSGELQELRAEQTRLQTELHELDRAFKNEINDLVDLIEEEAKLTKQRTELIIKHPAELIDQSLRKQSKELDGVQRELDSIRRELGEKFDGLYGEAVKFAHIVRDLGERTEDLELKDKAEEVSRKFIDMGLCRSFVVVPRGVSILNAEESSVTDNSRQFNAAAEQLSSLAQKLRERREGRQSSPSSSKHS